MYIAIVIFIITAVSNGANITDGLDGLAAGTSAIIGLTLAIFAYVVGQYVVFAVPQHYVHPRPGRTGGLYHRLLWEPALAFCGTMPIRPRCSWAIPVAWPSVALSAVLAFAVRKEILIPIMCGIFLVENLSVVLQVSYFKYTRKKYGAGRRLLKMAPLHHHYQKLNMPEAKIVTRFWLVGIMLAIFTLVTLKIR